jgi:hypothetical protein
MTTEELNRLKRALVLVLSETVIFSFILSGIFGLCFIVGSNNNISYPVLSYPILFGGMLL